MEGGVAGVGAASRPAVLFLAAGGGLVVASAASRPAGELALGALGSGHGAFLPVGARRVHQLGERLLPVLAVSLPVRAVFLRVRAVFLFLPSLVALLVVPAAASV